MNKHTRKDFENVSLYVGPSVEQTPAFGKKTLFVSAVLNTEEIEKHAREHKVSHIYLTAGHIFDDVELVNGVFKVGDIDASHWSEQAEYFLGRGYVVTVEYPAHKHAIALKVFSKSTWESIYFVPVLSAQIPNITTVNPNLTVKIDDTHFEGTNPGVWSMNYREVTDSNRFTDWVEYKNDVIINDVAPYVKPVSTVVDKGEQVGYSTSQLVKAYLNG